MRMLRLVGASRRPGRFRGIEPDRGIAPGRPADRGGRRSLYRREAGGAGVRPAPEADDATLVRRLTLDLVGRIPTEAEVRAYVESTDPDKRARLVDRLMATPGFVRHQAEAFDAMMMAGVKGSLREYLARAFGEGRPGTRSSASCSRPTSRSRAARGRPASSRRGPRTSTG